MQELENSRQSIRYIMKHNYIVTIWNNVCPWMSASLYPGLIAFAYMDRSLSMFYAHARMTELKSFSMYTEPI